MNTGIKSVIYEKIIIIFGFLFFFLSHTAIAAPLQIVAAQWPPYDDIKNESSPGYSTEVLKHVFEIMKVQTDFQEHPWKRAQQLVFDGDRDALRSAFYNEERDKYCYYPTEPLATAKYILFVKSEDVRKFNYKSYKDLEEKSIGYQIGASFPKEFQDVLDKNKKSSSFPDSRQGFKMLSSGRLDYVVAEHGNGVHIIKEMDLIGKVVPILTPSVKEDNIYIFFNKKNTTPDFVKKFSETLKTFKSTEDFKKIRAKYFEFSK